MVFAFQMHLGSELRFGGGESRSQCPPEALRSIADFPIGNDTRHVSPVESVLDAHERCRKSKRDFFSP